MQKSAGLRALIVGLLVLLMSIPALFVADIINARADYNRDTARSVGQEWGGAQTFTGPVLIIPVTEEVTEQVRLPVLDPDTAIHRQDANGNLQYRYQEETRTEQRAPLYVLPETFDAAVHARTEIRARGIFFVPVYTAEIEAQFDFPIDRLLAEVPPRQTLHWEDAQLEISVSSNRSLRGQAKLTASDASGFVIEPRDSGRGVQTELGDPRNHGTYSLNLGLFGSDHFSIAPVGRSNDVRIASDWPDPSFRGAFLPNTREVTANGFTADWSIPHLARSVPQISRESPLDLLNHSSAFGFELYQANDFYQKSFRAARYAVMFMGLTFLAMFLTDRSRTPPLHPVQYVLVGIAQLVFFLLMLALAEQIGFALAYGVSAAATIVLITAFGISALGSYRSASILGGGLILLYAVLYMILQSTDYAFLAGSILAFLAVAATMFATRNDVWYGDPNAPGWFRRKPKPAPNPQV